MNFYLRKIHWIVIVILFSLTAACKKEENVVAKLEAESTKKIELEKLMTYISISFDIDRDKIYYDETAEEFSVPNTVFKMSLKTIESAYESANEYKLNHEK